MTKTYLALVKMQTFSPISIAVPLTYLSSPVYPLPPQTTLLGALAYPLLRNSPKELEQSCSPTVKLLDHVVYATAGAEGYTITRTIERMYNTVYQKSSRWIEADKAEATPIDRKGEKGGEKLRWGILATGYVTYLNNSLYILYISKSIDILQYVYGITRIGKKEGLVSVEEVLIDEANKYIDASATKAETIFYVPRHLAECYPAKVYSMPILHRDNFCQSIRPQVQEFYVPLEVGKMVCRVLDNATVLRVNDLEVVIPKTVLR